ncbi:MAG TPA: hypothetical protein VF599_00005 [Pyrinomonadaceae bacterium]|jgi:hypothetical protein
MISKILAAFLLIVTISVFGNRASAQNGAQVDSSALLAVNLPAGAQRLDESKIPAEFVQLFDKVIEATGGKIKKGKTEVLYWEERKPKVDRLMQETIKNLQTAGWSYEVAEKSGDLTLFMVGKTAPVKRGFIGFWAALDGGLVLTVCEMLPVGDAPVTENTLKSKQSETPQAKVDSPSDAQVFNLGADEDSVNVMGSQMPKMPQFPALPKKPGKARGYVKDLVGNPLEGAYIGVRSTAVGGFHSGAQVETDVKGYYEIDVPWGATEFYAAGYTIDYGEGRAAMSLHPADGKDNTFASAEGAVENFVLIYHGLGDRNAISEKPWDSANYYGGSIRVDYEIHSGDMWASKGSLPPGSEIEITLAPEGELLGGAAGKTFVIRRKTGGINRFNINNIPIGRYKISARLTNGKTLKMRKTGYDYAPLFGLKPGEALGAASLLFVPSSAQPRSGKPLFSTWKPADIKLELP